MRVQRDLHGVANPFLLPTDGFDVTHDNASQVTNSRTGVPHESYRMIPTTISRGDEPLLPTLTG